MEKSNMKKELERIRKNLLAGKESLHVTEIRAEDLDAAIQTAIRAQEKIRKRSI